jgi:hypothetical protein
MDQSKNATEDFEFECPACHAKLAVSRNDMADLAQEVAAFDRRYDDPLDIAVAISAALLACLRKSPISRIT